MSRLSIELSAEQHNAIKAMALIEGVNIREYVIKRVFGDMEGKKSAKKTGKKPNARLIAAFKETIDKKHTLKSYKTAKELFDEYR